MPVELVSMIKTYPWQCMECKACVVCGQPHHEEEMMFCDVCDRGYHTFCVGLGAIPSGKDWKEGTLSLSEGALPALPFFGGCINTMMARRAWRPFHSREVAKAVVAGTCFSSLEQLIKDKWDSRWPVSSGSRAQCVQTSSWCSTEIAKAVAAICFKALVLFLYVI